MIDIDHAAELLIRLGLATVIGGAIGLNRDMHGKPAGLRMLGLVALGAALPTISVLGLGQNTDLPADAVSRVIQGVLLSGGANVFLSDGTIPMTDQLKLMDGTVGLPGLTFDSETNSGLYRAGAHDIAVAVNGVKVDDFKSTGGVDVTTTLKVPVGTTAQRDAVPYDGLLRYNSDLKQFEGYFNTNWQSVGSGQMLGNSTTKAIFYNSQTIGENLTVATGTNGLSAGPVTISDTCTVTVASGSVWSIF